MLKEEIDPSVADRLLQYGVIKFQQRERIHECRHRSDKCDILLKAIVKALSDDTTTEHVLKSFKEVGSLHLFKDFNIDKRKCTNSFSKTFLLNAFISIQILTKKKDVSA